MATVFNQFPAERSAFINPGDTTRPVPGFPEVCVTTFSADILGQFEELYHPKTIASLYTSNGVLPVYELCHRGKTVGIFLSRVGAPACAAGLEEIIAMGAKKIVMFGCCGIMDQKAVGDQIIIPSSAVRDEGTSYHYLAASEEIQTDPRSVDTLRRCLERLKIPYTVGKVWTTDAIYRETRAQIAARKAQGCLAVEMEYAAALAVARFREISLFTFLFGADCLDSPSWEQRDLADYGIKRGGRFLALALECAAGLSL